MNLLNFTPYAAGYAPGRLSDGRRCMVLVARATYRLPADPDTAATLADQQLPPAEADAWAGDPAASVPLHEADYVPFKPCCDVLLHGSAQCPDERPRARLPVGLAVGTHLRKRAEVVGERLWEQHRNRCQPGPAEPFTRLPLTWERAFGGTGTDADGRVFCHRENPRGRGYAPGQPAAGRVGTPLPNLEAPGRPLTAPVDDYPVLGFGPVARHWWPRAGYAGTWDDAWRAARMPGLPVDFEERFYQCAPADQQIPWPHGGEVVELWHLTATGYCRFALPRVAVAMSAIARNGERIALTPALDTLVLLPDAGLFTLLWRAHLPLREGLRDLASLLVGTPTPGWRRGQLTDKPWVPLERLTAFARRHAAGATDADAASR